MRFRSLSIDFDNLRCDEQTGLDTSVLKSSEMHQHTEPMHWYPSVYETQDAFVDERAIPLDVNRYIFLESFYMVFDMVHGL
mmetsp:Transcript_32319/g.62135  ORF Transcript_32319/g.62135 Transcript_32319/m.62135 type:complete len:81 (+) Transcript_32319:576-818(+)